jgi:hypothetical protein
VLANDLGELLGTAGGAAAASPLLLDSPSPGEVRGWIGAAFGGMVAGTALAAWLAYTPTDAPEDESAPTEPDDLVARWGLPTPTVLVSSVPSSRTVKPSDARPFRLEERKEPALGVAWSAELW